MARNKRSNRKSEFMMMDLELLSVLLGKNYPAEQMDQMWKTILINQFHDILPGSSIKEVYEVTKQEYDALAKQGKAMEQDYLHQLTSASDELTLFNTVGFERNSIVSLPEYKSSALKEDRKSTRLNSSHVSISYAVFCLKKKKKTKEPLTEQAS